MGKKWLVLMIVLALVVLYLVSPRVLMAQDEDSKEKTQTKITKIVPYKNGISYFEKEEYMGKKLVALIVMLVLLGGFLVSSAMLAAQDEESKEKPQTKITKIVLYKHGLGYFERLGIVKGDATVKLGFKTEQMQDVLTSLFTLDLDGGRITAVSYDSKDPIDKQLENILIRVPEGAALTQFLAQLKGAKVEVKIGDHVVRGSILGVEPINQKQDNMVVTAYKFVLLSETGEIQPYNLLEISSLKLLDEPIQKDLKRVLDIYLNSKYKDRKEVKVNCTGKGERNILMGYLIGMPIWKTSYRLILDEKQKPYLQGWAIVENPTDENWDNVQMSFVAGNPISFIMDLYTSYYPRRPVINLASIVPLVGGLFDVDNLAKQTQGIADEDSRDMNSPECAAEAYEMEDSLKAKRGERRVAPQMAPAPSGSIPIIRKPMAELLQSSISSLASGVQIGELFAYESKTPVSIDRNKAAMVPIITENVEGSKILYYRAEVSPRLMNAFYLTNSTKLTLESGPVTLFEGSTSVGEGLLKQSLQAGMKEIMAYAIETGCTLETTSQYHSKPIHKCKITNGMLVVNNYNINETVYKLANKTSRNQVVYLDHPRSGDYTLMEPKKAEEEIPGYYRFKLDLAAGKTVEFKVQEQIETLSQVYLQNISTDQIRFYLSQPPLSKSAQLLLKELADLMSQIAEQRRIYSEAQAESSRVSEDQNRYRSNMNTLNTNNPKERELREKYVEKLQSAEDKIAGLKEIMMGAQEKQNQLQRELIKKIQGFNED